MWTPRRRRGFRREFPLCMQLGVRFGYWGDLCDMTNFIGLILTSLRGRALRPKRVPVRRDSKALDVQKVVKCVP